MDGVKPLLNGQCRDERDQQQGHAAHAVGRCDPFSWKTLPNREPRTANREPRTANREPLKQCAFATATATAHYPAFAGGAWSHRRALLRLGGAPLMVGTQRPVARREAFPEPGDRQPKRGSPMRSRLCAASPGSGNRAWGVDWAAARSLVGMGGGAGGVLSESCG